MRAVDNASGTGRRGFPAGRGRRIGPGRGIGLRIGRGLRLGRGRSAVAAMAAACALTVAAAAPQAGHSSARPASSANGQAAQARYAATSQAATGCTDANADASLNPLSGTTDGPAVQAIQRRGRLIVGVDQNSYLWGFRDPTTGQIAGFDIDLVKAIAQNILGDSSKVQYLTVPTDKRFPDIAAHKVDMVVRTVTVNCQRIDDGAAFSTAYFTAGQQLLVPRDSSITGFDDSLKNKTVCTASGSTGQTKLKQGAHGASVIALANQLDCLVLVQLGKADAVFTDNALAAGQAAQDPEVHLVGTPVTHEPYGVAMNSDSPDLVRRVNQVLDTYRAGGAGSPWMRSYDTWLAKDLPGITGPPAPKYK